MQVPVPDQVALGTPCGTEQFAGAVQLMVDDDSEPLLQVYSAVPVEGATLSVTVNFALWAMVLPAAVPWVLMVQVVAP